MAWIRVAVARWGWVLVLTGACTPRNQAECTLNSDCAAGSFCKDGKCQPGCETDLDCLTNYRCNVATSQCYFPEVDAGPRRDAGQPRDAGSSSGGSSGASSSSGGGTTDVEGPCNPVAPDCMPGLTCVSIQGVGSLCLDLCTPARDGGVSQSTCTSDRRCLPTTGSTGVCMRMAGRDEACGDLINGYDPYLVCEPGLTRLVDNPSAPFLCGCKLLCNFADCPGANCPCPTSETCQGGILNSTTQGACGTTLAFGTDCGDPFAYLFQSSAYCAEAEGLPSGASAPIPWCDIADFSSFDNGKCKLICAYNGVNYACPPGTTCVPDDTGWLFYPASTCQPLDAGIAPPDAGGAMDAGSGLDAAVVDAAASDGSVTDGGSPVDAAVDGGRG